MEDRYIKVTRDDGDLEKQARDNRVANKIMYYWKMAKFASKVTLLYLFIKMCIIVF